MSLIIDNIVLLILINSTPYRKLDRRTYTVKKTVHSKEDMRCVNSKEDIRCTDITASDQGTHTHTHTQTHTRSCRPHPLPLVTFTLPRSLVATTYAIILL